MGHHTSTCHFKIHKKWNITKIQNRIQTTNKMIKQKHTEPDCYFLTMTLQLNHNDKTLKSGLFELRVGNELNVRRRRPSNTLELRLIVNLL